MSSGFEVSTRHGIKEIALQEDLAELQKDHSELGADFVALKKRIEEVAQLEDIGSRATCTRMDHESRRISKVEHRLDVAEEEVKNSASRGEVTDLRLRVHELERQVTQTDQCLEDAAKTADSHERRIGNLELKAGYDAAPPKEDPRTDAPSPPTTEIDELRSVLRRLVATIRNKDTDSWLDDVLHETTSAEKALKLGPCQPSPPDDVPSADEADSSLSEIADLLCSFTRLTAGQATSIDTLRAFIEAHDE